jgi:transposase
MRRYVGGSLQAEFMARVRGVDPRACLVVPVDVGKVEAMALVADHHGEVVVAPFRFALTERGYTELAAAVTCARAERDAQVCRVGVESAGHYHKTLVARLRATAFEVVELNPAAVKQGRAQQLLARLKSDELDLGAMAELLIRGAGRPPQCRSETMAEQAAWVAHRRRKWRAHCALRQQIHAQLDLVFPGLAGCFANVLDSRSGWVILRDIPDPARIIRLGADGLRRYVKRRGVRMTRTKASQVLDAARVVLALPAPERATLEQILSADLALLAAIDEQIAAAEAELARLLPDTPAGVLTSLPGIGTVRASNYGAALGDPARFPNAAKAYAAAGLIPARHESSRTHWPGLGITKAGSIELRQAIIELGIGLGHHHPEFLAYRKRLRAAGKAPGIAAVALGHRAHRLAFAMVRDQQSYDPQRWETATREGRPVMAKTSRSTTAT